MSREQILGSIRKALQAGGPAHDAPGEIPREYQSRGQLSFAETIALFTHRLEEYGSRVFPTPPGEIAATIRKALSSAGKHSLLVPPGIPAEWLSEGFAWVPDEGLDYSAIESCDGVLTSASAAVAESGSIALLHGPGEGRRVMTLLPDYHCCVLRSSQVVETLPECFARLRGNETHPVTFISGPSATADIEMTRIKGVHGPRFLDVVLVADQ